MPADFMPRTTSKIRPAYQPTNSLTAINAPTAHRIVDFAIFLGSGPPPSISSSSREPAYSQAQPSRDRTLPQRIASLLEQQQEAKNSGLTSMSINHFDQPAVRYSPLAVSIETKTDGRTIDEAKAQLGVWVAAHVARLEALIMHAQQQWQIAEAEAVTPAMQTRTHAAAATRTPNLHIFTKMVFPLICVHATHWTIYFACARPPGGPSSSASSFADNSDYSTATASNNTRKPQSALIIFEAGELGNTGSIRELYKLIKTLRILRGWIDRHMREWWGEVLGGLGW
jgi:hypothetical protein